MTDNLYYCDYCYYEKRLFIIVKFGDNDIEWNEDDPKDNLGIVRVPHLDPYYCSNMELFDQLDSSDELQFDKEDLPSLTLENAKQNIIVGIFTDEDM